MTIRRYLVLALFVLAIPSVSTAQDFGVMESAETINRGNVKLGGWPMFVFHDGGDNEGGFALTLGYGATDTIDVEGRASFFDDVTFVGGDVELWLVRDAPADVSARGGLHVGVSDIDAFDVTGFDLSVIASVPVADRLEVYGALDMAFNSAGHDHGFTTVHLVPGIEAALSDNLDLQAEFGVGANDDSRNYFSVGLSYYIR